jgi:hypothetical protein
VKIAALKPHLIFFILRLLQDRNISEIFKPSSYKTLSYKTWGAMVVLCDKKYYVGIGRAKK